MRIVVGVILLLLAVGLASLGVYFWTAPRGLQQPAPITVSKEGGPPVQADTTTDLWRDNDHSAFKNIIKGPTADSVAQAEKHIERPTIDSVDEPQKNIEPSVAGRVAESTKSKDLAKIVENRRRIEQLPKGNIVLDGPSAMKVSETRPVHANVGVN